MKGFDIDGFLNVLEPFYRGGDYDFLLNSEEELDLTEKRFIVFELDNISSHKVLCLWSHSSSWKPSSPRCAV